MKTQTSRQFFARLAARRFSRLLAASGAGMLSALLMAVPQSASAASFIKANNSTALNLNGSYTTAGVPGPGDIIQIDSTVTSSGTVAPLGGDLSILGIVLSNPTNGFNIGNPSGAVTGTVGTTLTLGASGIDMSAATGNLSITPSVAVGATETFNVAASRTLSLTSLDLGVSSNALTVTGAGNTTANFLVYGAGSLTKTGAGTLTLSLGGSFTTPSLFSGGITLNGTGGTLAISGRNAAGSGAITATAGTLTISTDQFIWSGGLTANGAAVNLNANDSGGTGTVALSAGTLTTGAASALENNTLNFTGGTLSFGTQTGNSIGGLTGNQNVALVNTTPAAVGLTLGFNNSSPSAYTGNLTGGTGAATLLKLGTGTQILNGANTFTGAITVGSNTVNNRGGVLELGGSNTTTAGVTVNASTLRLNFNSGAAAVPATNILSASNALTLGGGILAILGKDNATTAGQTFASTGLTANTASTVNVAAGVGTSTAFVNLGAITRNAGTGLNFVLPAGTASSTNGVLIGSGTASSLLVSTAGATYATVGGTDYAAKDATNAFVVPYSTVGTYNTATGTSLGTSTQNSDINGTDPTVAASATINTLRFSDAAARTLTIGSGQTLTNNAGGILVSSAVTTAGSKITGGNLTAGTAVELVVHQFSSQPFTLDSVVTGSAVILTKDGPGTLVLTKANTFGGNTYIDSGTLQIGVGGSLVNSQINLAANDPTAVFDVNNQALIVKGISGGGAAGGYINLGATGSLTVTPNGGSNTFGGALVGGVGSSITETSSGFGLGFQTGNNIGFFGTLTVNTGGNSSINNAASSMINAAVVDNGTFSNNTSPGVGSLSGAGTLTGTGTLSVGYLGTNTTFSGIVASSEGIIKVGGGTTTFSGASTTTGATNILGGNLVYDYSTGNDVTSSATTQGNFTITGGTATFRGGTGVAKNSDTTGTFAIANAVLSQLVLNSNGGTGFALTLTTASSTIASNSQSEFLIDTSTSTGNVVKTSTALTASTATPANSLGIVNGLVQTEGGTANTATGFRANVLVHDSTGYGFATQDASNNLVRYTAATTLNSPADTGTATTGTGNYLINASLTRTATLDFGTLQIDSAAGATTVSLGANSFNTTATSGHSLLVTGTNGATLTATTGVGGQPLGVFNYQNGGTLAGQTFTLDAPVSGNLTVNGTGLVDYTRPAALDVNVQSGVLRLSGAQGWGDALSGNLGVARISNGVLEIGADLNGTTSSTSAGSFSRSVGASTGQVLLWNDAGFSAYTAVAGGTQTVNLGGAATPTRVNWGQDNFLTSSSNLEINATFRLSSAYANATLDFQNPINLNGIIRTVDVANGSAAVDARLSGVISNITLNGNNANNPILNTMGGLNKNGLGTLELTANNTYNGPTSVNAGTLLIDNTPVAGVGSGTGTATVTVNNGGTLGGTGAVSGAATVGAGGQITGANLGTIGALTLRSTVTFSGAVGSLATYVVDIGSGANNSDRLAIGGALNLSGTFDQITFTGSPDGTSSYVLATYASVAGTFDTGTAPAGYTFLYTPTELDLVPAAVPEPATWLGGGLLLGLATWSQRKRLRSSRRTA